MPANVQKVTHSHRAHIESGRWISLRQLDACVCHSLFVTHRDHSPVGRWGPTTLNLVLVAGR